MNVKQLNDGEKTPSFDLPTIDGRRLTDVDLENQWTLLSFHRYAACPVCNLTLQDYRRHSSELEHLGVMKKVVFHSPTEKLLQFMTADEFPFEICADPERQVYRAFGVEPQSTALFRPASGLAFLKTIGKARLSSPTQADGPLTTCPADFIVAPDRTIAYAHYGTHIGDSLTVEDLIERLPNLREAFASQSD